MDDKQIIRLFFERSEQAITELSQKYGALCFRIADNILNDHQDAEECVNDAWLGAWNSIPPQSPDPLRAYICRVVRNHSLKKLRTNSALKRGSQFEVSLASVYDVAGEAVPDKVSLFQTLLQIWEHFNQMTAQDGRSLNITVQGTDISVDTDVSTVVALVINELLQNAYKYAFPGRKDGNVHIELNNGSLYPLLTVADDGVGFDVSSATSAGMGYRIINMLVQNNLGSQLDIRSGPEGTRVTFGFHLR